MLRAVDDVTRSVTFMKPVQTGGSVLGEVLLCYWIRFAYGFLQFNWSNDDRAKERWNSRIESILRACLPVATMMDSLLGYSDGEINFGKLFFRMQGVFVPDNIDSDSVTFQLNEEIHSWKPGHLEKARNRLTAVWNYKAIDISNAGDVKDQLDVAFRNGTQEHWEVRCPGCGKTHRMRTHWDPNRPDLGGLRYDADGCRVGHFEYNYNKLRPTIHYQMPCGYTVHNEDLITRKAMSDNGDYSDPTNPNAELKYRSYTYEAVSVDFIDWMMLIKQKHDALRARSQGDPEPWKRYKRERECIPYDPNDVPLLNIVTINKEVKKNRDGLPGNKMRRFSLDRQQGQKSKNEFPYWWITIRDAQITEKGKFKSRLVYEGRLDTDDEVVQVLKEHSCQMWQGVADSGDDTEHVYLFCLKHGINALKGTAEKFYAHEGGARRIFSPGRPLHQMLGREPKYPYLEISSAQGPVNVPDPREPMFFLYSKYGIRERLDFLRSETEWETPVDVSEDYRLHMEAEQREEITSPRDGSKSFVYRQLKDRNDLYVCECYFALQVDMVGLTLVQLETMKGNDGRTTTAPTPANRPEPTNGGSSNSGKRSNGVWWEHSGAGVHGS
jgi:hypothetical protein